MFVRCSVTLKVTSRSYLRETLNDTFLDRIYTRYTVESRSRRYGFKVIELGRTFFYSCFILFCFLDNSKYQNGLICYN